jgi:5-hydroxyisourate hydrolase-like protein (transthyretin family)
MNLLTDGEGRFYVAGLPLGKYRARAEIPGNLRITYQTEKDVEISEGRCSGVIFIATSLSRISGRLVDAQGKPVEGVKIDLVPVDSSNKEISNEQDFESRTDKEGRYSFDTLAAGRYSVAINHKGQPITHDQIYRTTFYPNTTDLSQARILALAEGQELTVDDFSLPPRIVEASIEGVVLWADGSPVRRAGVDLELIDHQTTEQIAMTDDEGRFSIKGIEGFRYRVHASIIQNRRPMHAEPVEVLMGQRGKPITLVINIIGRDPVYLRKQSSAPQK